MNGNIMWSAGVGVVLYAVLYSVFMMFRKKRDGSSTLSLAGGFPIIGNLFDMTIDVILERMKCHVKTYGKNFRLQVFHKKIVHISDAKLCREILSKRPKLLKRGENIEKFAYTMGYLPYGLFHSIEPAIWSKMKKMTAPAFSKQNIQSMAKVFYEESMLMVQKIQSAAVDNKTVDMLRAANNLTVRVISKVAFGNEPVEYFFDKQFYEDTNLTFRVILEDAMFNFPRWVWKLTPMYQRELQVIEGNVRLEKACLEVIHRKRQQHAQMSEAQKRELHDLIDILIRQEGVTDEEILANVKTFYLAGSDTTSVSISWAMLLLHQHPEVVARMRDEVRSLFAMPLQDLPAAAISDAIAALPYCLAVFKEALRLYPVGPLLIFDFLEKEPLTLSNGLTIESDNNIILNAWACMLDPDNFSDPHVFQPARWMTQDKEELQRMELAFLGFGGGTRACPGMSLAFSEGVMGLAALVHHFDFAVACPLEEVKVEYKFTMQPNKLPMTFTPRADI